jgi:RIO kinase 2
MDAVREEKPGGDSEDGESDEDEGDESESGEESEEEESEESESEAADVQGELAAETGAAEHSPHDPLEEGPSNHAEVDPTGSPQRSRAPSPTDSLTAHTSALQLRSPTKARRHAGGDDEEDEEGEETENEGSENDGTPVPAKLSRDAIRERITSDVARQHARQTNKYHSKRSTRRVGRPKGSKAKQDTRVKIDRSGVWE